MMEVQCIHLPFEHHATEIGAGTQEVLLRVCPPLNPATQVNGTSGRDNKMETAGSRVSAGEHDQGCMVRPDQLEEHQCRFTGASFRCRYHNKVILADGVAALSLRVFDAERKRGGWLAGENKGFRPFKQDYLPRTGERDYQRTWFIPLFRH
jgi:hypothetical protein